jgi:hypothetical protein
MKLGDICTAPCFAAARNFEIPAPGCSRDSLVFAREGGRDFYAVLLNNHSPERRMFLDPKVAVVGLSPGGTQIDEFISAYARSKNYGDASIEGAFAGLSKGIISMLRGLGLAGKLEIDFPHDTLALHPDVFVTSLVACASLSAAGSSDAFDPKRYKGAERCIADRFVHEMLSPNFKQLRAILILGSHGWRAVEKLRFSSHQTVAEKLRSAGKVVMQLPHPSGQNGEYVRLASMSDLEFPNCDIYVDRCWHDYRDSHDAKQSESAYKAKRRSTWQSIRSLRDRISLMPPLEAAYSLA